MHMADDLVLYTNPMSRGRVARWMLEEVGAPYRVEILDYGTTMKAPDYLAINPMGKVPAITTTARWSPKTPRSAPISPMPFRRRGLRRRRPSARTYYRWLFFAAGPFEDAVTNKPSG